MRIFSASLLLSLPLLLAACGGSGSDSQSVAPPKPSDPTPEVGSPPPAFALNSIIKGMGGPNLLKYTWDGKTKGIDYTVCLEDAKLENNCRPLATGTDVNFLEASLPNLLEDHNATFFIMASNGAGKTISSEKQIDNDDVNGLIQIITDKNQVENAFFGASLDISEDGQTMVVGASGIDPLLNMTVGNYTGAAYVYVKNGTQWVKKTKLIINYAYRYGKPLAISADGKTIAVGWAKVPGAGKVSIFNLKSEAWVESAVIEPDTIETGTFSDNLSSISLSGDGKRLVIAGAEPYPSNEMKIFALGNTNTWEYEGSFKNSSIKKVEINKKGDFIVASLLTHSGADGVPTGGVKFYRLVSGAWNQEEIIEPSRPTEYMDFGSSFTINDTGTLIAIGSSKDNAFPEGQNIEKSGSVYIYNKTNTVWNQIAHLKGSNTKANDQFGFSVAFNSDASQLAVGAIYNDSNRKGLGLLNNVDPENWNRTNSGAVYVFALQEGTWNETKFIKAPDRFFHDSFGTALAWSREKQLIITAPKRDEKEVSGEIFDIIKADAGAIYVY